MANFKGTGILDIKKIIKNKGEEMEKQFLSRLTPAELNVCKNCLPVTWVPTDIATSISAKAAEALFPHDPDGLVKLGMERARIQFTGLYKLLFRIFNMETLITNAAGMWSGLHDKGEAHVEKSGDPNQVVYAVTGYPDLHANLRKMIRGYIASLVESAGQRRYEVTLDESNPQSWKWKVHWW